MKTTLTTKIAFTSLKAWEIPIRGINLILLGGLFILLKPANVLAAPGCFQQEQFVAIQIKPNDVTILMSDRAKLTGNLKVFNIDPTNLKRFWVQNWKNPDDSFEWTLNAPADGLYTADMLIEGAPGNKIEIAGPVNSLICTLQVTGWDKIAVPGELSLRKGTNKISVKAMEPANLKFKSLELINLADKSNIEERIRKFRSNTKWMVHAGFGLMFQWGEWGYPQHGAKKPWPKMIDDFNVDAFANMVAEVEAGYVVWSATWSTYFFPAPIKAIDNILPGRTCSRDLIGELADALNKRGIKLILYYHLGHGENVNLEWWKNNWVSQDDQTIFIKNFCSITTEVGERYGKKLAGWMIDDGMIYYPSPFEQLGKALKAGNSHRLIAYNSWILPRFTEFQDFFFGEGNEKGIDGAGPKGGNGIVADGPQKGLQGFANFILDGPNWGIAQPETTINPPQYTKDQIASLVKNAMERKLVMSFNLLMYEDGSVSPASLEMMKYVRSIARGK
ncbi:MAG: hypothetical protein D4R64_13475 [Porphyromonadaceae bacterium]|nr:MAG: hypothetical protein D4R64_13475 [Porphyromonadaceae bacterium]